MRRALPLGLAFAAALAGRAGAQPATTFWVDLVGRGATVRAPASWLDGGTGRLAFGDGDDRCLGAVAGEAQLGAEWRPGDRFTAHLHARARGQQAGAGDTAGIVEAWLQLRAQPRGGSDGFRLRAGQMFLPTSRENVGPLWSSPYTLTLSALNSWVGEEVRPVGVLAEYDAFADATRGVRAGLCIFGGNDASGTLLAWRGWSLGDRLSTTGEKLPLPALPSLAPGGPFAEQDRRGTTPVGRDLDGRPGWAGWIRVRESDRGLLQLTRYDSRGDRALHHGEYAWDTRFDQAGGELHPALGWTVAAEHLAGETAMGVPAPRADASFHATYLLVSWERGAVRVSGRWDDFATRDEDHLAAGERSDEDGHAWTVAVLWQATPALGLALEGADVHATRPSLSGPGIRSDGGRSLGVGFRYRVGSAG
jgi:hypothetical protein